MNKNKVLKISIISVIALIIIGIVFVTILMLGKDEGHTHDWKQVLIEATCDLEGSSYEKCECGEIRNEEKIEALGHSYVDGKCTVCGASEGHTHQIVIDEAINATCTTVGLTEGSHCETCGLILREQVKIAKLGHDLKNWEVHQESTEKVNGEKRRECTRCDYYESAKLPLSNHKYEKQEIVEPTCIEYGYTLYKCSDCDDSYKDDFVEKIDHKDHVSEVEVTCISDGYTKYECEICGRIKITDYKLAEGHSFGNWIVSKQNTCLEEGLETRSCNNCQEKQIRIVEKKNHDYVLIKEQVLSSTSEYECNNCGHKIVTSSKNDVNNLTNSEIYVDENFTFDVVYNGTDEKDLKNNIIILDICLMGSEYEKNPEAWEKYDIKKQDGNVWTIIPNITSDNNGTFVVTLKNDLTFKDYYGNTLTYTFEGEEKEVIEYNEDIKFLLNLEKINPGYYPYFITTNDTTDYIYLTIQSIDDLNIGDILYVGPATSISTIFDYDEECIIGKINEIYQNEIEEYIVVLEAPELDEVFNELDVHAVENVDFEEFKNLEENISDEALVSFSQSEDFLKFLLSANKTSQDYAKTLSLSAAPINEDTISEEVKIERPKVKFSKNTITITIEGKYSNPINSTNGNEIGSFEIGFKAVAELGFDISADIKIKYKWGFIPTGVKYFDVKLKQSDKFTFDFDVSFNIDYDKEDAEHPTFLYIETTGKIHSGDCVFLDRIDDIEFIEIKPEELMKYAEDPFYSVCYNCKPVKKLNSMVYVIDKGNNLVHANKCKHVKEISDNNKEFYYGSKDKLKDYTFCEDCDPEQQVIVDFKELLLNNLEHSDWSDEINKIKSWATSSGQNESERKTLSLGRFNFKILPGVTAELDLDFVLKFDFKATLDYTYEQSNKNVYGVRLQNNKLKPYSTHQSSSVKEDLTVTGEVNFQTGIGAGINVSLLGLNKWVNVGMTIEMGVNIEFDGIAHIEKEDGESKEYAGIYADGHLYIDVDASYKLFKDKGSVSIYSTKFQVFKYGYDKAYYNYVNELEDINISTKEYQIDLNSLLEVYYYDIQNQKTKEEVLSLNSELYTITFEFENGTYCEYQNGKIIIKNNAPTAFKDKLIIKVKGNTSWKNYVKGSAAVYLDALEIDINYVDKTTHTHKESDWNIVKNPTCTELGIKEIKCTECQEVLKTENIDKIDHNYVDGICTMCNEKDPNYSESHTHKESDWNIVKNPTCTELGIKEIKCTECQEVLKTENIDKIDHNYTDGICTMCNSSDPNVNTQELKYTLKDDHYVVTGLGTCTDTVITILSVYKGSPVTEIGDFAFMNDDLTSITIPSSITKIGWQAFINCKKLKKVIFEDNSNLKTIDDKAFEGCVGLTSITIPMSVETIGEDSFYNCGSMEEVIFEENSKLLTIGKKAFSSCSKIVELDLPKSLINIEGYAFWSCGNLERITLPNGLIKIGFNAFESCTKLTEIIIPSSVTKVESYAFINCSSITIYCEVATCPNTWSSSWNTDNYPVVWNYNGEVHTHSESSWYVTKEATCTEEGVKVISCTSCGAILKTDVVEKVSHNYIDGVCTMCQEKDPDYIEENTLAFETNASGTTCRVTGIGTCTDSNIIIPSEYKGLKVTSIYDNAFKGCTNIVSVTIPGTIRSIGNNAFKNCSSLREVSIGNGVTSIEMGAFDNCVNLGSILIPKSIKIINSYAFYGCTNLKEVKFEENSMLTSIVDSAFDSCISLAEIHLPKSVQKIYDSAFYGCESLFKVVIPSSVTLIEDDAFKNCSNLTIYCEAQSLPSGWETNWNPDNREVIWGYTG